MRYQKIKGSLILEWEVQKNDHGIFQFVFKLREFNSPYIDGISVNVIQEANHVVFTFILKSDGIPELTLQKRISKSWIGMPKDIMYQDFFAGNDKANRIYSFIMIEKRKTVFPETKITQETF